MILNLVSLYGDHCICSRAQAAGLAQPIGRRVEELIVEALAFLEPIVMRHRMSAFGERRADEFERPSEDGVVIGERLIVCVNRDDQQFHILRVEGGD